jgi:uncharacterized repeat protein (TIGR01451 family)
VNVSALDSCAIMRYNETSANVPVTYVSALNVTKTADTAGPVALGNTINYTITVCNIGDLNLTDVLVNDSLLGPVNLGTLAPGACNWTAGNYTVTADDACTGWINNTVNVSALDSCAIMRYNETSASVTTTYNASLNVTKTADTAGPVAPGGTINYTITVCNTGNVKVTNVTVNDPKLGIVNVSLDTLGPGNCTSMERNYTVNETDCTTGWINNTATVIGTDNCGKNITAATPASWNVMVKCEYCIAGYKVNQSSGLGLANWTINVKNSTGEIIANTTTEETGYWQVCGLTRGNYTVCEVLQSGWAIVDPTSGCYENVSLGVANITDLNFTNCECNGSISNYVWLDENQNGIQDVGESGIAGVTVNLYQYESPETLIGTTVTNGVGYYIFDKLCAGNYSLEFILPPGYAFTQPNQGADDEQDSDVDPSTWSTGVFTLGAGENNTTIDAGLYLFLQVPAITPPGIVALIGLLSLIATCTMIRKKKR